MLNYFGDDATPPLERPQDSQQYLLARVPFPVRVPGAACLDATLGLSQQAYERQQAQARARNDRWSRGATLDDRVGVRVRVETR
jgi:hypothetical protein